MIWIVTGLMIVIALGFLLVPLLKPAAAHLAARKSHDIAVYREQLLELEADVARGQISEEQARVAQLEIERRMLKADSAGEQPENTTSPGHYKLWAGGLSIFVIIFGLGLYLKLGKPALEGHAFTPPAAEGTDNIADGQPRLPELVERLIAHLRANPDSIEGWSHLRRALASMGDNVRAAKLLEEAIKIRPGDLELRTMYGESLVVLSEGKVSPAARLAFEQAAALDRDHPGPRYYLALAKFQADDLEGAYRDWVAMAAEAPADAPWRPQLMAQIRRTAEKLRLSEDNTRPSNSAGPPLDAEQRAAIAAMSPEDQQNMIRSMVQRLADRLEEEPEDYEGWIRLARAYTVLGDKPKSINALRRASDAAPPELAAEIDKEISILEGGQKSE